MDLKMDGLLMVQALAYGVADRFAGGGFGWNRLAHDHGGPLHGKGTFYATPLLMALGYFIGGWWLAGTALAWGFYRGGLPWKIAGHSAITPETVGDHVVGLLRHALPALIMGAAAVIAIQDGYDAPILLPPMLLLAAFAAISLASAYAHLIGLLRNGAIMGRMTSDEVARAATRANGRVEFVRGVMFGLCVGVAWILEASHG